MIYNEKNKTNHPILSNSHPLATANKAIHNLKIWGMLQNQPGDVTLGTLILQKPFLHSRARLNCDVEQPCLWHVVDHI